MPTMTVDLDKQSKRVAKRYKKMLPTKEINSGVNRVIKRELTRVRKEAVKKVAQTTPLKQKFLRAWSGVKASKGSGVFWMIARNLRMDRAGEISGRGGVVSARKRILSKRVVAQEGTFIIGKSALRRDRSKRLRPYFIPVANQIKQGFKSSLANINLELGEALERELQFRLDRHTAKITR